MCYLCKESGHPAALCPDRPMTEELMMYGHYIEGLGFFHIEVEDVPLPRFRRSLPSYPSWGPGSLRQR